MLVIDDRRIFDDVLANIVRQLNPRRRSERYALCNCLLVSRRYFQVAAEHLWSSVILTADPRPYQRNPRHPSKVLHDFVLATDPPTENGMIAPHSRSQRFVLYLRSIRTFACNEFARSDGLVNYVPHYRLLPWLQRLDRVNAAGAPEVWLQALKDWCSFPGRLPLHIGITAAAAGGGGELLGALGCKVRSVRMVSPSRCNDGGLAAFFKDVTRGQDNNSLYAISVLNAAGAADCEECADYFNTYGSTVRCLELVYNPSKRMYFSDVTKTPALRPVNQLTHLYITAADPWSCSLTSKLLTASGPTLLELKLRISILKTLHDLPMRQLHHLKSLGLEIWHCESQEGHDSWSEVMPSVARLNITGFSWQINRLIAVTNTANHMTELRKLTIELEDFDGNYLIGENTKELDVLLSLKDLRIVSFMWPLQERPGARLVIVNWEEIKSTGLPYLEDILLNCSFFDEEDNEGMQMLRELVDDILMDEMKTPALAIAQVHVWDSNGKLLHEFFWRATEAGLAARTNGMRCW
ncbi:hypothetical protein HK101_004976 [Irineochytrium annulatum]|nr:hypothetical protein HK101_004976 [Irineochytrium annulatum]